MDFDIQKMDELLELSRENNKILHKMRRMQHFSSFLSLVYWAVILGSIFGTYYYFQPTIQKYMKALQTSVDTLQQLEGKAGAIPADLQSLKNLLGR